MKKEVIIYSDGAPISAYVYEPEGLDGEKPAIIICHGHSRHKDDGLAPLAEKLCSAGFAVIAMDFRGCGAGSVHRYHLYCSSEWPRDLVNTIYYAQGLPFVDKERIGVAGISMGAATAVYVAGMDDRVGSIVSMAGIADCKTWLEGVWERNNGAWNGFLAEVLEDKSKSVADGESRLFPTLEMYHSPREEQEELKEECSRDKDVNGYLSYDSIESLLWYKPVEKCPGITAPVFFIHGGADKLVPVENSKMMYGAVASEKKKIKIYEEAEHNLPCDPNHDEIFSDIVEWFLHTI